MSLTFFIVMMSIYYIDTMDVRNELLIVLYLDIHVSHDKDQNIPI